MIGTVARASKDGQASPCAVIVDGQSLCVLSACCKAYDIIEKGATVVEGLMKRRQPLPDVDAIYFVSATAESVEAITKDFHGDKAQHKKVHIFLSGPLNNESGILEILTKSSSLLPRLRSLVEFNLNFIAYESRIFHLNRPDSLAEVYEGEEGSNMATLGAIADQLLTLCATFKDIPNIRFQTGASRFTEQIASLLHAKLKRLDWLGTRGRTTLVIIDRSIDCAPLFLHEYTYQAVAYDLLDASKAARRFLTMGLMEMSEAPTSDKGGAKHVNKITRERFKFFQRRARTTDYELSRFEPRVKEIMEQACQDSLHLGKFPFVAEPERQRGGRQDISGKGGNIRARDGVEWSFGEVHSAKGKQQPEEEQPGKSKRTLIFFVIGGISMSEMRCAYEVARQQEVDVYLGGSTILTPRQVIQQLKRKPNHNNY
eukprot:Polyplicarium_translucidae@DN3284_c0_g2_i7.p1